MAPRRAPKSIKSDRNATKIERPISKAKKTKKKNYRSFGSYLFKVLKSLSPDCGISRQSMLIMNSFVMDMLEKIAAEAGSLVMHGKKSTMDFRDLQSAVRLLIPGDLWKHANGQGMRAVKMYNDDNIQKD